MAERSAGPRSWPLVPAVLLALAAAVSGCGTIPSSGPVETAGPIADSERQPVRLKVFPLPPRPGDSPAGVVGGFLQAATNDATGYPIARQYLATPVRSGWRPQGVQVYEAGQGRTLRGAEADIDLTGTAVGQVDEEGGYRPQNGQQQVTTRFHLVSEAGQWRIANPPSQLHILRFDFERVFRTYNLYFLDRNRRMLVPDPIWLPNQPGITTELVVRLLRGPTSWLRPAVTTAFPPRTVLAGEQVAVQESTAVVPLSRALRDAGQDDLRNLSAQLVWTLTQVPGITAIQLSTPGVGLGTAENGGSGESPERRTRESLRSYNPNLPDPDSTGYYLKGTRLVAVGRGPVDGPFGEGRVEAAVVAVEPASNRRAAAISADRTSVRVAALTRDAAVSTWLTGAKALTALSWDGAGNLWAAGSAPDGSPRIWVLRGDPDQPRVLTATVDGLSGTVRQLRISRDGARVALVVGGDEAGDEGPAPRALLLGRVEWSNLPEAVHVVIRGLTPLTPNLSSVQDVAWSGPGALTVLGVADGPQVYEVTVDGWRVTPVQTGVAGPLSVAAAAGQPLMVTAESAVYQHSRAGWRRLDVGRSPVYPG